MQRKNSRAGNRRTTRSASSAAHGTSLLGAALGIAGGVGVGAIVMYLFDPNQGGRRRHELADRANHALSGTGDALGGAWESVSSHAGELPKMGEKLLHQAQGMSEEAQETAREKARSWMASARSRLPSMPSWQRQRDRINFAAPVVAAAGAGVSALVIGASAMWLFDPDRGRSRRAWLMQKTEHCIRETGRLMRATGRHLRNKGQGYYHEGRAMAEDAMESATQRFSPSPQGEREAEEVPMSARPN